MSLRLRLLLVVATTFAVVVVGCVYAAHVSAEHELRAETDRFLTQRSHDPMITGGLRGFDPDRDGDHGGQAPPALVEPDAITQFLAPNGTVTRFVTGSPRLPVDDRDKAMAAHAEQPRFRDVTVNGTPYRVLTVSLPGSGAVQIGRSVKETNDLLSTLDLRLLLIALLGTVVAAALAWLIARRLVRPVEQLTAAAEQVADTQDLAQRIDVERHDELGRLATSFNTMLVALGDSRDQQQRLVMDASHELRTPLTALRTNIELLQRATALDDSQRSEILGAAHVELEELGDLVAELVDLATDARAEEPTQHVDLGELVDTVVQRQRRRTGRTITVTLHEPAMVNVRASAIDRAVNNLLDNACKFSPEGSDVEVVVDGTRVEVLDRGPGVDERDRDRVFDRFYRTASARTRPGSGLGLSIVKQIVELHGGTVRLDARNGNGTIARLELPEANRRG